MEKPGNKTTKPSSWLQGARPETMPEWIKTNPKAFRLLYEFASRSSWKERDIEFEGVLIHLNLREFITGRPSTSKKVGITEQEYRTLYKRFEKLAYIQTIKVTSQFTIGLYLADGIFFNNPPSNQPMGQPSHQPTGNQPVTTIKKVKKVKEGLNNTEPSAGIEKSFEEIPQRGGGFNAVGLLLRDINIPNQPLTTSKWQSDALRLASRLGNMKPSESWFKIFRDAHAKGLGGLLESAASFCADAQGIKDIEDFFFWKFHQLAKAKETKLKEGGNG